MNDPLWSPSAERVNGAAITALAKSFGAADYCELHQGSVEDPERFWRTVWNDCGVIGETGDKVLANGSAMPGARWFPDAKLNFAENLLRCRDDRVALVSILEDGSRRELSYHTLYARATGLAIWLRDRGIEPGDRVAAFMPNVAETIIAMLATTSIGATFSSCSPDFGIQGVLDRFGQIEPKVLVCADGYRYNGKALDSTERVQSIVESVPSLEHVLFCPLINPDASLDVSLPVQRLSDVPDNDSEFSFPRFPFDHPLYIMYSSGTTGVPKCIVHGAGGTLLQHLKEHRYHVGLDCDDRFFYFTTCGWMMWNWLVSGLASGARLILFDGSPFYPDPKSLIQLAEQEGVTIFGTSARYIASLEKARVRPKAFDLSALKTILSTGSPLSPESFRYVYREFKADVCLSSISGGTDIVSCFALGNPALPVYEGELQCLGLGLDVRIFNEDGESVVGEKGELVCTAPFPSMPIGFWNDPDGEKYHDAYFSRFPGIWAHGDYGERTAHDGMIIHGRSDAVLNPGGVRIGTAEIYRQVEKLDEVMDAVCVGQQYRGDERVILFVVLREGRALDDDLVARIRDTIRSNATPRHVPAKIVAVADIPRTISGKTVELAVRRAIHGEPIKNTDALANPESLEQFRNLDALR